MNAAQSPHGQGNRDQHCCGHSLVPAECRMQSADCKEGRREGGKEGRREGGKEGRREGGRTLLWAHGRSAFILSSVSSFSSVSPKAPSSIECPIVCRSNKLLQPYLGLAKAAFSARMSALLDSARPVSNAGRHCGHWLRKGTTFACRCTSCPTTTGNDLDMCPTPRRNE